MSATSRCRSVCRDQPRFDPEMVMELISTAPSELKCMEFHLKRFHYGGKWITYTAVQSSFRNCLEKTVAMAIVRIFATSSN